MSRMLETLRQSSTFRFFPTKLKCWISKAILSSVFFREVKQSNKTSSFAVLGANGGRGGDTFIFYWLQYIFCTDILVSDRYLETGARDAGRKVCNTSFQSYQRLPDFNKNWKSSLKTIWWYQSSWELFQVVTCWYADRERKRERETRWSQ